MGRHYRHKHAVVAMQWDGAKAAWENILALVDGNVGGMHNKVGRFYLRTCGKLVAVDVGDWVVKDAMGTLSVVPHQTFEVLFEPD